MFIHLLKRLKISLDELEYFCNEADYYPERKILIQIRDAYLKQDINALNKIALMCQKNYKNNIDLLHFESFVHLLLSKMTNTEINFQETYLFKYLINIETWSHYEIVLFNNALHHFDIETLNLLLPNVIKDFNWYSELQQDMNETVQLISNAVIYFYLHDDLNKAFYYTDYLNKITLKEQMTFEKLFVKLFISIENDILMNDPTFNKSRKVIDIFKTLDMTQHYKLVVNLLKKLEKYT